MALTKQEKETIVNFDEANSYASVFTYNSQWKRKLMELSRICPECRLLRSGEGCVEYQIPKSWITIQAPRRLSDQERRKMAERAARNFGKK